MTDQPREVTTGQFKAAEVGVIKEYNFKWKQEIFYGLIAAAGLAIFQIMSSFDPEQVTDWKFWGANAVAAVMRAVGAAGVNMLVRLLGKG